MYGIFAFVALTNLLLMRRPGHGIGFGSGDPKLAILIPARNEERNLTELLPLLVGKAPVFVFDDESEDGTTEVAAANGATVVQPEGPLPKGWTGKNRACHELGRAAAGTETEWFVYLDADVRPAADFVDTIRQLCRDADARKIPMISGFPTIVPGRGVEPLFLGWVGWALLSTNPYGIVSRTGRGHNRFTNGQFHCWRRELYTSMWPNESVKGYIMEDVMMGRLLAKRGVRVEVANVSRVLSVKMYDHWRETLDGMSKNSYEIMGSAPGSYAMALLLLAVGWAWMFAPASYVLFAVSGVAAGAIVRARPLGYLLVVLTLPIVLTIGAYTIVRSVSWRRRRKVIWKGRVYEG